MAEEIKPNPPDPPAPAAPENPAPPPAAAAPPAAAKPPAAAPKPPPPKPPPAPTVMVTTPWDDELTKELAQEFGSRITEYCSYLGQNFLIAQPEAIVDVIGYLRDECAFDYLADVTALHYPKNEKPFEVIYVLYSFARNQRIRVKIKLAEGEKPRSVTGVHVGADWLEREVFDMFGIEFSGHPNLKRILMPDEWNGYPLRKDYGILQQDAAWVQENLGIESGQ